MPRTKSLATLINHYGNEREFKLKVNKISDVYKILNREIFNNRLKKPYILTRRMHGALGLFEFNPYATKHCYRICLLYTSPSPRDDVISRMPSSA